MKLKFFELIRNFSRPVLDPLEGVNPSSTSMEELSTTTKDSLINTKRFSASSPNLLFSSAGKVIVDYKLYRVPLCYFRAHIISAFSATSILYYSECYTQTLPAFTIIPLVLLAEVRSVMLDTYPYIHSPLELSSVATVIKPSSSLFLVDSIGTQTIDDVVKNIPNSDKETQCSFEYRFKVSNKVNTSNSRTQVCNNDFKFKGITSSNSRCLLS